MARAKKTETEINTDAVVTEEKPKRKAGRPPKAKQEETKTAAKRPAARKAAKAADTGTDKTKKSGGRKKTAEKDIAAAKKTMKKSAAPAVEKPKRKYVRKPKTEQLAEAAAPVEALPQETTTEEIIDKIINTDISTPTEAAPAESGESKIAKDLLDLNEEEAKVLKAFVKALTAALNEK